MAGLELTVSEEAWRAFKAEEPSGAYEPRHKDGFVYFIAAGKFVKIGNSIDPVQRMDKMKCDCPFPLFLLGMIRSPDVFLAELLIHKRFRQLHVRGEWFKLTPKIRDFIAKESDLNDDKEKES